MHPVKYAYQGSESSPGSPQTHALHCSLAPPVHRAVSVVHARAGAVPWGLCGQGGAVCPPWADASALMDRGCCLGLVFQHCV